MFIQGAAATPVSLVQAMTSVAKETLLKDISVCHMHTEGPAPYANQDYRGKHYQQTLFVLNFLRFVLFHFSLFTPLVS